MYGLPYLRVQGGANSIIIDPQPGDIGIAVFASRDITNVKSTKAQANPGSFRTHDFSDGMYIGGLLNGVPTQYIKFSDTGIEIVSPNNLRMTVGSASVEIMESGEVSITAPTLTANIAGAANITATGVVTITGSDVSIAPLNGGTF
jgi:hypothetical protein